MADVTVLGAGGSTVTISLTSADNAAAAQLLVNKVNALTALDIVDVQIQAGAGTLPAATKALAAAIFTGTGFNGTSGGQYTLFGANGAGANTVLGGQNASTVVVAGDGANLTYANQSANAQLFYGNNSGNITNYEGKVTATTGTGIRQLATDSDSTTVLNLGVGGVVNVIDVGAGLGATTVNAMGSGTINAFASSASVTGLLNIELTKGDVKIGLAGMPAVINPGGANVTIVGNHLTAATLFGGTGSVQASFVSGQLTGGSAGGNIMFSSTVSGSTTLMGGSGANNTLGAQGAGQTLVASTGNATLGAASSQGATGGSTFNLGAGGATVLGFEGGGNTINIGAGNNLKMEVLGRNGAETGAANTYNDLGTGTGQTTIHDFTTGLDKINVNGDFSITFFALTDPANATGSEVTLLQLASGASYTFFDSTPDGVQNIFNTDITKAG